MMRNRMILLLLCLAAALTPVMADETLVVATTPWTGAFLQAAGVEEYTILAPFEMLHPTEYELKPSDIKTIMDADLLIYAGYEVMMPRLKNTVGKDTAKLLQITTNYNPADLRKSVLSIAQLTGTVDKARENLQAIDRFYEDWKLYLNQKGLIGASVIVHFFQRPLLAELGFNITGVFGPGPLEPKQISELAKTGTILIIDNYHNPMASPLEEVIKDSIRVEWINFPGKDGSRSLLDVLKYNKNQLDKMVF